VPVVASVGLDLLRGWGAEAGSGPRPQPGRGVAAEAGDWASAGRVSGWAGIGV